MSDNDIVWQDPPARLGRGYAPWVKETIAELQQHPGKWALVRHYEQYGSANPKRAELKALGCESTVRRADDGGADIYACWPEDTDG